MTSDSQIDLGVPPPPPLASQSQTVAEVANATPSKFKGHHSSSIHAFSVAEKTAFVKHINTVLEDVPELSSKLPIDPTSDDIFEAVRDGVLLCFCDISKLINASVPGTIEESKMIKYFKDEKSKIHHVLVNQNLCIDGARKIGAIIVNLGAEDLMEGKPYLVFGLLWQIIKIGMLKEITLAAHPELANLKEGEEDLSDLPPEELLLKWLNWHLAKSGYSKKVQSFSDLTDSSAYLHLMHHLAPDVCSLDAVDEPDSLKRAEQVLLNAENIGCKSFLTAEDIVQGNEKLNLVFTANMFNKHIGMVPITEAMEKENETLYQENTALKTQIQSLQVSVQSLNVSTVKQEEAILKVASDNSILLRQIEELKKEREELATKVHKMYEANEKLFDHVRIVDEEKLSMEIALSEMKFKYEDMNSKLNMTHEELARERVSLETSEYCGASLASDLESLRSRQEKLEYLIEHLKIERMRSDMHVERLRILYNSFATTEALCEAIYRDCSLENVKKNAAKTGFLTKKARNGSSWKYRYFVLRDNFLFYWKNDKDLHARFSGVIRVDDAVIKFAENPTRRDLKDQWLLAIEVPNNNDAIKSHSFYISGEDHELEGWKTQIRTAAGWWTKRSRVRVSQ